MAKRREKKVQFFNNKGGLNTKASPLSIPHEDTPYLLNVDLTKTGAIKKAKGYSQYSAAIGGASQIDGIFRLIKKTGGSYTIAAEGGQFYEESPAGTFNTSRASGLQTDRQWSAVAYNDKLYLANGYDPVKVYKGGEAITDLQNESGASVPSAWVGTDQPSGLMLTHHARAERIAAWGVGSDPSRVWFSAIQDPEDWTTSDNAFNVLVLKDNGEPVTVVVPLFDLVVVFKKTQSAVYSGDSVDTLGLQQIFPVGTSAPHSIGMVGRDMYFWSQVGPALSRGITEYGDIAPNHIGLKIEDEIAKVNWGLISQTRIVHDKENDRVIWFAPDGSDYRNKKAFVWHYDVGGWSIYDFVGAHSALVYDDTGGATSILLGDYDGTINEFDRGFNAGGSAYTATYITPWYDYGDYNIRKRILELQFANSGNGYNVNIYYQWDFEADWHSLGSLSDFLPVGSAIWGSGVKWGDGTKWGAGQLGIVRLKPKGSGKVFRMKLENTTVDTSFEVLGWSMVAAIRGRR